VQFEFATAGRILFGPGISRTIPDLVTTLGSRALLVTGRSMPSAQVGAARFIVSGEPTVQVARDGVELFRSMRCDAVVGIGGGSVIDAAKAIAALATNGGEPLDYLEVVGKGRVMENAPAPFIAVPTTAGTGSEVTRNAVLGLPEQEIKTSLRSAMMLPRIAVIDPELTLRLPPTLTASTGLDALTQLIEPYVSARANAMTDVYCLEGIRRVARSLRRAYDEGSNLEARTDMAFASLLGGLSLANAGLGVVHGFAAPIGGRFDAPHGAVCAALLPHGMAANIQAGAALPRYSDIARLLTGKPEPEAAVAWVTDLCADMGIPRLATYGIEPKHVDILCDNAKRASSMKANPVVLSQVQLRETLLAAI
jgi:alcohol dehydrogenase class IV